MQIVGLPDADVNVSKERVPSPTRIIVNLTPADPRKEGPAYDLPIALGITAAADQIHTDLTETVFLGELSRPMKIKAWLGRSVFVCTGGLAR